MNNRDSNAIRNISDTALWVAIYRARESERPDAHFRDPYARRLAGERGEKIAAEMQKKMSIEWPMIARTVNIDDVVRDAVAKGADMVINLAAGLDSRPYRLELPAGLRWVEVDLSDMVDHKEQALAGETPEVQTRTDKDGPPRRRGPSILFSRLNDKCSPCSGHLRGITRLPVRGRGRRSRTRFVDHPNFREWVVDSRQPPAAQDDEKDIPDARRRRRVDEIRSRRGTKLL